MITLDEFKNMLMEKFLVNENDYIELLEKKYDDGYLQKIIDDTYDFIREILDSEEIKKGYLVLEDMDEYKKYIDELYLDTQDCKMKERLYIVSDDRIISTKIMNYVFGNKMSIYYSEEERWRESEMEDEEWWDIVYTIKFRGFPVEKLDEIKNNLFGKNKLLVR